ncbi:rop guanine nucleotide exchange factor 9-like [Phragmites australis]|uniref:rop guanine nucleotide exchange factor 9-like n=1 Tax=Phragmites australis TaxID=29695 RepID=UPI002D7721D1|nr:rop guanine nucleotide exchange factor 9-like [Phragmites australis]
MARPFLKIEHGLHRFSFNRRRRSASDDTGSCPMEAPAAVQPSARRALSRSCGSKGSRLLVDLPPPLPGGPSDKAAAASSSSAPVPVKPARHEGPHSDAEVVREKFSKLLLGEDMSGTGKGVSSALALSNAITNLAASVFGEQRRLQPMAAEQKARWKKEIDWLLSVADYIVEFVPSQQVSENGTCMEIMVTQQRQDLQMNIPALRKLDAMLLEYLDSFKDKQEFWYVSKDADDSEKGNTPRQDDKWWLPTVRVPPNGLSDTYRKWLQNQKDLVAQVLKAAMAINANVLMEMEVPEAYMESLPKNGKSSLGDSMYKIITDDYFDPEELLSSVDLSEEHNIVDLKNRIEASVVIWQKKMTKDSKLSWGHGISHEKRGMFEGRAENVLLLIKHRFPGIAQSALDISKIQYNRDVGLAILESYSRTLESLAFTVMSRIEDVLNADSATQDPKNAESMRIPSLLTYDTDKVVSDAKAEVEKLRRMEPVSATLFDFVGPRDQDLNTYGKEDANGPKLTKVSSIATRRFSYLEKLEHLGGTRSPISRH